MCALRRIYARASLPGSVYTVQGPETFYSVPNHQGKLIYRGKPDFYMAYTVNAVRRQAPSTHTHPRSPARAHTQTHQAHCPFLL